MRVYHNYYYTFGETIKYKDLDDFMSEYAGIYEWYTVEDKPYLDELWKRLKNMFNRKGIYFNIVDKDYDLSDQTQYDEYLYLPETRMRIDDLMDIIGDTKDKYIEVIRNQEDLKGTLLNDVVNISEHYFNDTPQTEGSGINTTYTSTYSKDTQKVSLGPVSAKLKEVEKAMEDKYDLWLNHFKKFIIVQEN